MALNPDWKEFVELLNSKQVEYLVVGAFALAFHGKPRLTGDIDFFVRNSPENARRLLDVLREFGFGSLSITEADFTSPDRVVQLGFPPRRIDLLTRITGVDFQGAWTRRCSGNLDGVPVSFLSIEDFRANKLAVGRTKDLADLESLENLS